MPITHAGRLAKNEPIWSRLSCLFNTALPRASTPWIWNTFFAKSMPIVVMFMMDAPSGSSGLITLPLWHNDAVSGGGVHTIALLEPHSPLWVADSTGGCNTLAAMAAEGVLQMKYRRRIYYSASQRALMWDRWQKGETLHQIARLFDRHHSAIQGILAETGGIRPAERHRSSQALTLSEREDISRGVVAGRSIRSIAASLGRAPSTVSRELHRNGGAGGYRASRADQAAWARACRPKVCKLVRNRALAQLVASKLCLEWSPEQIAGWLKRSYPNDPTYQVSHETIYRSLFIQARGALKKELMAHLRRTRGMRRSRHYTQKTGIHGRIVDAVPISERPAAVEDRAVPGHWEGDLLFGSKNSQIATLVERQSRYLMLAKVDSKDT